ncbi:MAG: xanthine dehydrogenase molybdopterin binding subunit [Austwickia sp.]|nr:MAG: xanthine dehydrogenase molybdopterin binding subunit [Austwickia sp.]
MTSFVDRPTDGAVGRALAHVDAPGHVTGEAYFTDDLVGRYAGALHAYPVRAPHAHARVLRMDVAPALELPGVVRVLTADDVPGINDSGVHQDEPLFPSEVMYHSQAVAWVLAETRELARRGAASVEVDYEPLPALVTIAEAIAAESFQGGQPVLRSGDAAGALAAAAHRFAGELEIGGQEHFYLETHASIAMVDEAGQVFIQSSTQHPTETQEITAHVLGRHSNAITVQCLRMGGGFGGKEFQPHGLAAVAALGATLTGRPVSLRLDRQLDMTMTGKRHPFHADWEAGFDDAGHLLALRATLTADGGWSLDLSEAILARALCHIDNAYHVPNVEVHGRIAKTHKTSQTAFRGFGGPQGMLVVEDIMGRCAPRLGLAPDELRRRNLYVAGQRTPYGQDVKDAERIGEIWDRLLHTADFASRTAEIARFNAENPHRKRALAMTPEKFGISFNFTPLNQAGALVHVYKDGSVLINHGGTEMGQGLHTKMIQVAATALGVPVEIVRLAPTRTDKVPNTSATAASSGADLNGAAVKDACDQIRERLADVAATVLNRRIEGLAVPPRDIRFGGGLVYPLGRPEVSLTFKDLVTTAYLTRTKLWAAGFYRTEGLHWNGAAVQGAPFKYFSYGVACAEVEVEAFTGTPTVRRADILQDVGDSLSPLIDVGQIEGGFVQGVGWMTQEQLLWDTSDGPGRGRLLTQAASTYKLPSIGELPPVFNIELAQRATETGVVYGSKAIGEPPLTLSICVREAIRQACAAFGPDGREQALGMPATAEATYWAVQDARGAHAGPGSQDHDEDASEPLEEAGQVAVQQGDPTTHGPGEAHDEAALPVR